MNRFSFLFARRVLGLYVATLMVTPSVMESVLAERPASFQVATQKNILVSMRDGIQLATDVYLPAQDGQAIVQKFPVILTRTPYDKSGNANLGNYFASRGYAFVAQDTRGRYLSEGVWRWLTDDGADGVDTAQWIGGQSWSNGRIGMIGTSYVGGTQHALAMAQSPYLKTVIAVDAVCNMGYASMRNGGAFEMRFWNWIMLNSGRGSRAARDPQTQSVLKEMADQRHRYLSLQPFRRGTTPAIANPLEWRLEWYHRWLKDKQDVVGEVDPFKTPVRIFVMGTGDTRSEHASV
jgi:uncharacterized protein